MYKPPVDRPRRGLYEIYVKIFASIKLVGFARSASRARMRVCGTTCEIRPTLQTTRAHNGSALKLPTNKRFVLRLLRFFLRVNTFTFYLQHSRNGREKEGKDFMGCWACTRIGSGHPDLNGFLSLLAHAKNYHLINYIILGQI